ncbi:ATP-binding protein [Micromonospora aurantiaca (nom. illeg.)]|uniref:ATP-binding protein n=1 Tax=Micromonospora aurantiaca (nom. illeg.) TaxID=47850 RepID=UPI00165692FD|nr:AAA family ATPase [Micromonospora aurantiaca]MBC9001388.1 AAA family ATPase [Micromonospora aurantiaca]
MAEVLTVPLHEKGAEAPLSTLIFGDNGAGKSSIVDALEFVVRGQVSRRGVGGKKQRKELRNLFLSTPPAVVAKTDSGTLLARGAVNGIANARILKGRSVPEGVGGWPVAIRRQDVEEFWRVDDDRRLEFFYDYFLPAGASFADEQRRTEAIRLYDEAASAHEEVRNKLVPYLGRWRGEFPEHTSAISAFRRILLQQSGVGGKGRKELGALVDEFEFTLSRRNQLSGPAQASRGAKTIDLERVAHVLDSLAVAVAQDFRSATGLAWLSNVHFHVSDSGRLSVDLITTAGRVCDPRDLLSEAYLDLLALMIVVEVHLALAEGTERRFVALDDVFQSVDAPLRQSALRHIASRLAGWQIVVTLHDGLWLKSAAKILGADENIRILRLHSRGQGASPIILDERAGPLADLDFCIAHRVSPILLVQAAGRAIESLCHELSFAWKVKLQRPRRDEYKLANLWEALRPILSRCSEPLAAEAYSRLDSAKFLRNEAAHPNETAESLSEAESVTFGEDVRTLWRALACLRCGRIVKNPAASGGWVPEQSCRHVAPR